MIYQWYSGSDSSKEVPRRLTKLNQRGSGVSVEEAVTTLRGLLSIEHDPNWRGYLLWRVGREYLKEERVKEAVASFFEAKDSFDPLLATMREVRTEYCDTLYQLILEHFYDRGDMEAIAALTVSISANLEEAQLSDFQKAMVFSCQGFAFEMLARQHSLEFLRPLALASYLRWHRLAPEDPRCLVHLAYAYFNAKDIGRCWAAIEMFREVAPEGEERDSLEDFVRQHEVELATRER